MDTNNENNNSTNVETDQAENLETAEEVLDDIVVETQEDAELLKEKNKALFARAKKAEKEAKELKAKFQQEKKEPVKPQVNEDDILRKIDERLEERELSSLDLEDELKEKVKLYAKMEKVPIKKALQSDYIKYMVDEAKRNAKNDEASTSSTRKPTKQDYSSMKASDFDVTTKEGAEAFEEYKKHMKV